MMSTTEAALVSIGDHIPAGIDWSFSGKFEPNGSEYGFKSSLYVGVDIEGMGALAHESAGWGSTTYGDIHWIMPDHGQGDTSQYTTIQQAIDAGITFRIGHSTWIAITSVILSGPGLRTDCWRPRWSLSPRDCFSSYRMVTGNRIRYPAFGLSGLRQASLLRRPRGPLPRRTPPRSGPVPGHVASD